jgi:hypothetical protein
VQLLKDAKTVVKHGETELRACYDKINGALIRRNAGDAFAASVMLKRFAMQARDSCNVLDLPSAAA